MSDEKPKSKRGGARPGTGPKPRKIESLAIAATPIDGRTVEGKNHATYLINQLNAIDPLLMQHKDLMVSSEPIEIPGDCTDATRKDLEKQEARRQALWTLKQRAIKKFRKLSYELQGWAPLWFWERTALDTRKYLHDKSEGKAVQTLNHLHDKPIDVIVKHSLSERFRMAMEKAEKRVSNG
jgi:hypothetical protein